MKREVVVFDFDGTLTTKDTLWEFIKFVKGRTALYTGLIVCFPVLAAYLLRIYPNYKAKQKIFSYFFKGMKYSVFCRHGKEFIPLVDRIANTQLTEELESRKKRDSTVYIISASITEWVGPWGKAHGVTDVIGTQIEVDEHGIITGRFLSKNCYGKEKVNRLLEAEPERSSYHLVAYGDSSGDKEMLEFADKGYYLGKTFTQKLSALLKQKKLQEVIRFCIVGCLAVLIQFCTYYFLVSPMSHNIALIISYIISMAFNFVLTVYFTFRVNPTINKGVKFVLSHILNFALQFGLLNLFIWLNVEKRLAIIPVLLICVPTNFLLVRLSVK